MTGDLALKWIVEASRRRSLLMCIGIGEDIIFIKVLRTPSRARASHGKVVRQSLYGLCTMQPLTAK